MNVSCAIDREDDNVVALHHRLGNRPQPFAANGSSKATAGNLQCFGALVSFDAAMPMTVTATAAPRGEFFNILACAEKAGLVERAGVQWP
jgi:hypothetical protein